MFVVQWCGQIQSPHSLMLLAIREHKGVGVHSTTKLTEESHAFKQCCQLIFPDIQAMLPVNISWQTNLSYIKHYTTQVYVNSTTMMHIYIQLILYNESNY